MSEWTITADSCQQTREESRLRVLLHIRKIPSHPGPGRSPMPKKELLGSHSASDRCHGRASQTTDLLERRERHHVSRQEKERQYSKWVAFLLQSFKVSKQALLFLCV